MTIWNYIRKPLISIFIVSYIASVALCGMAPSVWRDAFLKPIKPAILYLNLWQHYNVFAPNPYHINFDLEAYITFNNGMYIVWKYPRVEQMGIVERVIQQRWQRFGYDYLNWNENKILWPDFARFVARLEDTPIYHPVSVTLVRHWVDIPPPEKGLGKPLPKHNNTYAFFTYRVKAEDLQ